MDRIAALTTRIGIPAITQRHLLLITGTLAAAGMTALAAALRIPLPFSPVPVTGQTMMVLISGAILGPLAGSLSQVLFIVMGAAGVVPLAGGALTGVTFGYLIGFVIAARSVGGCTRRTDSALTVGLAMGLASLTILLCGSAWLWVSQGLSVGQALSVGLLPFLPGDALKALAALAFWRAGSGAWRRLSGTAAH